MQETIRSRASRTTHRPPPQKIICQAGQDERPCSPMTTRNMPFAPAKIKSSFPFFLASHFYVTGASADRTKFGNKVLRWYMDHQLPVTPVHPSGAIIEGLPSLKALTPDDVQDVKASISVITPPHVTLLLLQTLAENPNIVGMWLQPGAADAAVIQWIRAQSQAVQNKIVYFDACILVQGAALLQQQRSGRM